jgi:hypothetical protein
MIRFVDRRDPRAAGKRMQLRGANALSLGEIKHIEWVLGSAIA